MWIWQTGEVYVDLATWQSTKLNLAKWPTTNVPYSLRHGPRCPILHYCVTKSKIFTLKPVFFSFNFCDVETVASIPQHIPPYLATHD